jgi:heme exporter protein B
MATHALLARTVRAVLTKDVRIELRSREVTVTAALFGLLVALVAAAAFGGATTSPAVAAAGTLWTSQLFAAVFAFARFWHRERDHRAWTTTKLLAGDPLGIFAAKVFALFLVLVPVGLVGLAVTALFLHVPADAALARAAALVLLAFVGFAALGTLFGLLTVETKARDLLLAVVLLPLLAPMTLGAMATTRDVLLGTPRDLWLGGYALVAVFDAVALALGASLFRLVAR